MTQPGTTRRHDIDWLRTLAFMVLILYHVGMYYVADWGWHIKSEQTSEWLQNLMLLTAPWRMSLLFFISAIALALAQRSAGIPGGLHLARLRTRRLLIPLLFGMFVIVVPQTYIEAMNQSLIEPGYFQFWAKYVNPRTDLLPAHQTFIGLLTWNHLWFLPYLWIYSMLLLPLSKQLQRLAQRRHFQRVPPLVAVIAVVAVQMLIWWWLRARFPQTHALVNDWYNHGRYFLVFVFGYLFALQPRWWQFVIERRRAFLGLAIACYLLILADHNGAFSALDPATAAHPGLRLIVATVVALNHWAWIFAAVGFAGFYLNRPSPVLRYTNPAILPWYLLHQTLIILFAWWLKPLALPTGIEAVVLLALTVAGCIGGYAVIRRVGVLRWLCWMPVASGSRALPRPVVAQ